MDLQKTTKDLILLTLLLSLLFGAALGAFPLHTPDAARYAEIPREMLTSGDYITPHLNGLEYFEKPPLFYWIQAVNLKFFGSNVLAANLANAALSLLTCLMVYLAASKLYERRSGFFAALTLATSLLFCAMAHITTTDMALTFFLSATLLLFILGVHAPSNTERNTYYYLTFIAAALTLMTKGLIGVVFPAAIIFLWLTIFRQWRTIKTWSLASGFVLFLAIAAPWHIIMQLRHPDFFHFYFIEQHFLRYFTPYAGREQAWWFFPAVLMGGLYPWTFFMFQALIYHLSKIALALRPQKIYNHTSNENISRTSTVSATKLAQITGYFLLWAAFIYIFYSFSDSRLIPYLLPILPPLTILLGNYLATLWKLKLKHKFSISIGFYTFTSFSLMVGLSLLLLPYFLHEPMLINLHFARLLLALLFISAGVITTAVYHCYGFNKGITTLFSLMMILLISATPLIALIVTPKSTLPIALYLKPRLQPNDEVVSFENYYQDLPFYLERYISVVNYRGELAFGIDHHKNQNWMIDQKTLWQRWQSNHRMYMIVDNDDYARLLTNVDVKQTLYPLLKIKNKVLVTNIYP